MRIDRNKPNKIFAGFCAHNKFDEVVAFVAATQCDMLFMDAPGAASAAYVASPSSTIIHRRYDESIYNMDVRTRWASMKREGINRNVWHQLGNEDGYDDKLLAYHVEFAEYNESKGADALKVIYLNVAVGNPQNVNSNEWQTNENAVKLLKLISARPDIAMLGLHEYGHWSVASSLQVNKLWHKDEIGIWAFEKPELWPEFLDGNDKNFHCGRYVEVLNACLALGIKPPMMYITETGLDSNRDVTSKPHYFSDDSHGWQEVASTGRLDRIFRRGSHAEQIHAMMWYLEKVVYNNPFIKGMVWYNWNCANCKEWSRYDVAPLMDGGMKDLLIKGNKPLLMYGKSPKPHINTPFYTENPPVVEPPKEPPKETLIKYIVKSLPKGVTYRNVRSVPTDKNNEPVGTVKVGSVVEVFALVGDWYEIRWSDDVPRAYVFAPRMELEKRDDLTAYRVVFDVNLSNADVSDVAAMVEPVIDKYARKRGLEANLSITKR